MCRRVGRDLARVRGQAAERHGLLVRLEVELSVRDTLQHLSGVGHFLIEFR